MSRAPLLLTPILLALGACGDDDGPAREPLFPAGYASTFVEVRNCRRSADHELNYIRVVADPSARGTYVDRMGLFAAGATLVKEEYDFADDTCSGEIVQWATIQRLPLDSSLPTLDWRWQRVSRDRVVES